MQPLHKFQFSSFFVHCLFSWPWFSHTQKKPLKQSWRLFKHTIFLRWSLWFHSLLFSTSERFSKLWKFLKKKKWQQQGRPLNEFLSSNFLTTFSNSKVSNATTSKRNSGFHETDSQTLQRNLKRWMSWFVVKTIHASWILNSHGLTSRQCSKENLQLKNSNHWAEWSPRQAELQNLQERQSLKECLHSWQTTGKCLNLFQSPLDALNCEKSILTRNRFSKGRKCHATHLRPTEQPSKKIPFGTTQRGFLFYFDLFLSCSINLLIHSRNIQLVLYKKELFSSERQYPKEENKLHIIYHVFHSSSSGSTPFFTTRTSASLWTIILQFIWTMKFKWSVLRRFSSVGVGSQWYSDQSSPETTMLFPWYKISDIKNIIKNKKFMSCKSIISKKKNLQKRVSFVRLFFCSMIIESCSLLIDFESEGSEWHIHKIWPQNRASKSRTLSLLLLWLHQQNIDMQYTVQLRW